MFELISTFTIRFSKFDSRFFFVGFVSVFCSSCSNILVYKSVLTSDLWNIEELNLVELRFISSVSIWVFDSSYLRVFGLFLASDRFSVLVILKLKFKFIILFLRPICGIS